MKKRMKVARFLHSRKWMYRAGWTFYVLSLPSGWNVLGFIVWGNRDFPQNVAPIRLVGLILLTLGLFSNLALYAARNIRFWSGPVRSWRALLFGFLAINVSVMFFLPAIAKVPGYWLWLIGFAAVSWSLTMLPRESALQTSVANSTTVSGDDIPGVVWAFLSVTIFWLGVTVGNYYHFHNRPTRPAPVAQTTKPVPLTSYLTDDAGLLKTNAELSFRNALLTDLAAFEHDTSNQIAVAIYPHLPPEPVEDFTIRIAQASRLGRKDVDNGVILFVFMAEHVARIEVGYGLEGALPDALSRRILDRELAPRFARGEYVEGIRNTVAAIRNAIADEYANARKESVVAIVFSSMRVTAVKITHEVWPFLRDSSLGTRLGLSLFGVLLGFGVWSGIVNGARFLWDVAEGTWNLIRRRPFRTGMVSFSVLPMFDTLKLVALFAVIAVACVFVAGGGSFGGAGAAIHWRS